MISTDEYERLKEIESILETIEDKEIYELVQDRKATPKSDYISVDEMAKKFNIDME